MSGFDEYLKKKRQEEEQNPPQARQSGFQAYLAERQAGDSLYDQWLAGEQRRQQSALAANQYYTSRNQQQYQARQAQQAQQRVQPGGDLYDYYRRTQRQNTPAPAMTGREISGAMRSMETARRAIENPEADNGINASLSSNWLREAAHQEASRLPSMDVSGGLESIRDRIKALDADPMQDNGVNASVMGAAMQESAQLKAYRDTIREEAEADWRRAEQARDSAVTSDAQEYSKLDEDARTKKAIWGYIYAATTDTDAQQAWKDFQDAEALAANDVIYTDEQAEMWFGPGAKGNADTFEQTHQALVDDAERKRAIYEAIVNYEGTRRVGEAEGAKAQAERTYQEAYAALTDAEIRGDEEGIKRAREAVERAEAAQKASSELYENAYKETYGAGRHGGKAFWDRVRAGAIDFAGKFFTAPQLLLSWLPEGSELKKAANAAGNTFATGSQDYREIAAMSTKAMGDNPWWERGLSMVEEGTRQTLDFMMVAMLGGGGGASAGAGEAAKAAAAQGRIRDALIEGAKFYYTNPEYWSVFLMEAGNGYQENIKRGMTQPRAAVLALLNASVNAKLEFGLPGMDNGGLQSLYQKSGGQWDSITQACLDMLDSGIGEAKEELEQGIAEGIILKSLWNNGEAPGSENGMRWFSATEGEDAVFNTRDLGEAALAGGLMGISGAPVRMGLEIARNSRTNYYEQVREAAAKYVQQYGDEGLQEMIRQGVQIAPESSTYHQAAVDLSQRLDEATDVEKARFIGYAQEWAEQADEQERQTQDRLGHVATNDETMRGYVEAAADAVMPEQRNAFVSTWNMAQTDNVEGFATEFRRLYNQGTTAQNMDEALASVKTMTREQAVRAYGIGLAEHQAQQATVQRGARTAGQLSITQNGQTQTYTDATMRTSSFYKGLNQQQKTAVDIGTAYSAALGVNVNFFQTEDLADPIQGYYDAGTSTISINLNAGLESEADITDNSKYIGARILGHEITHFAEQWAPAEYDAFRSSVFSVLKARGVDVDALIDEQMARAEAARARGVNVTMSYDDATREVIADSMTDIFRDTTLAQQMAQENPGLFRRIVNKVKELVTKIRKYFSQLAPNTYEGAAALQEEVDGQLRYLDDIVKQWEAMERKAGENLRAAVANPASESIGIQIDTNTESAAPSQFSLRTWTHSEYVEERARAVDELAKALGISKKKAGAYIDGINSIAKIIADDQARLDYESSPGRSSFVSNVEYGGSIDFSTLCKKRRLMTGTISAIQEALSNVALTPADFLQIRNMMKEKNLEVSCGLCYVEGSRAGMGMFTKEFIALWKKHHPGAWAPNMAEMNTPDGIEQVRMEHPEVYEAYEYFWNHYGTLEDSDPKLFASQQKPKLYQLRTEYKNEILTHFKSDSTVEQKNRNGGLRIQSFSDFEIVHLIDMMQVIMDMSKVGLAGQAYTKVPDFALALGDTGLKINLSLIAKDVDENGQLIFDDVEGMPHDTAFRIRDMYSKNVGTIIVTFTDAQLKAAMADPRIDFIIPFHRSQWKRSQYEAMGLPANTKDYTYMQNERYIKPQYHEYHGRQVKDKASNYMPNEYWDFKLSGKENAENYLRMCAENNKRPKFYKLLVNNGDGSYSLQPDGSTDGYWKLLIDFKMYDNDGVGSPQMPVRPDFNMQEATRMLNEYQGGHEKFPVASGIVKDFVDQYKASHKGVQYSLRINPQMEREYQAAAKNGDERKASALVKEAAAAAGYTVEGYHGTQQFGFTNIDVSKSDDRTSFFVTTDINTARTYSSKDGIRRISDEAENAEETGYFALDKALDKASDAGGEFAVLMAEANGIGPDDIDDIGNNKLELWQTRITDGLEEIAKSVTEFADLEDVDDQLREYLDGELWGAYDALHPGENEYDEWLEDVEGGEMLLAMEMAQEAYYEYASLLAGENDDANSGNYHVYINPDNLFVIDCKGDNWNYIEGYGELPETNKGRYWNTRTLSEWAQKRGYAGVLFQNVIDDGGQGGVRVRTPADVYALFKPQEQVKSADPFTYDENGNLISLADRFNPQNPDIRYSLRQTHTPEFKRWFGNSVVVNEDGTPKVLYHQTSRDFSVFSTDNPVAGANDSETPNGIFLKANDHDIGIGGNIQMPLYARMERPLRFANRSEANAWYVKNIDGYASLQREMENALKPIDSELQRTEDKMFADEVSQEEYDRLDGEWNAILENMREVENSYRGRLRELLNNYFLKNDSGYDGIILGYDGHRYVNGVRENVNTYIVFKNTQIKSATDNVGTFSHQNPDIRYSLARPTLSNRDLLRQVAVDLNDIATEAGFTENQISAVQAVVDDIDALNNASSMLREATAQLRSASAEWNHRIEDAKKARAASRPMSSQKWKAADAVVKELEAGKEAAMADLRSIWEMRSAEVSRYQAAVARAESGQTAQFVLRKARDLAMRNMRRAEHEAVTAYRLQRDEKTAAAINRKYIQREARDLREWMLKPDRKNYMKHVPLPFQEALVGFLESIDESSERKLKGGEPTRADMRMIQNMNKLRRVIAGTDPDTKDPVFFDLPVGYADQISDQITQIQSIIANSTSSDGYVLNRMTSEQLKSLRDIIKVLKRVIQNFNSFYNATLYKHVYEAAENTIDTLKQYEDHNNNEFVDQIGNFINWQNLRPAYGFERFGDGGRAVWNSIKQGQSKLAFLAKEIIDFSEETFKPEEAKAWNEEIKELTLPSGGKVRMTVSQIMSLYELNKRDQARIHLYGGGFRPTNIERKFGRTISNRNHQVDVADVDYIISQLTDRQKDVADKLQAYMAGRGGELANEVSMRRFMLKQFTEENYFPINSDGRNIAITEKSEAMGNSTLFALINASFTKDTKENANNALAVYPIFEVFANHMADVAQYNAFALPVLDALKWINYQERDENGKPVEGRSVKNAMMNAYGYSDKFGSGYAVDFVKGIIAGLNSSESNSSKFDRIFTQALHHFNATRVAFNGRVIVQQPLAIARAAAVMDPRDIVTGIKPERIRSNIAEMRQHSGLALWKSLGFFDVNISNSLSNLISQNSDWKQRMTEIGLMGAEFGDTITWATLWEAAKNQATRENYHDEAKLTRAAEIFDNMVLKTQVVDSVITKSEFMRQKNYVNRLFSSFMAEPTTTASMLSDAMFRYNNEIRAYGRSGAWQRNWKNIARTTAVFAVTALLNASITAIYDSWRDDDDYQTFWEKVLEHFENNIKQEVNPGRLLPLISDIVEYTEYIVRKDFLGDRDAYYNPTSIMPQSLETLEKAIDKTKKLMNGDTSITGIYNAVSKLLDAVSGIAGIPAYPILREIKDAWNNIAGRINPKWKVRTYDPGVKTRVKDAFMTGYLTEDEAKAELLKDDPEADVKIVGDWKAQRDLGIKYDDIDNAFLDDELTFDDTVDAYINYGYMSEEDALEKVTLLDWQKQNGDTMSSAGLKAYRTFCEGKGISEADFTTVYKAKSRGGKKDEVVRTIDWLDATAEQKDALYRSVGYSEKEIVKTPWHQ